MDADTAATTLAYPGIAAVLDEVFQYSGPVSAATSPNEIQRWDSLQHIALIQMLESTFAIKLSMDEMMEMRSVGDIEAVLRRHGV